jgi:hypothetical protein
MLTQDTFFRNSAPAHAQSMHEVCLSFSTSTYPTFRPLATPITTQTGQATPLMARKRGPHLPDGAGTCSWSHLSIGISIVLLCGLLLVVFASHSGPGLLQGGGLLNPRTWDVLDPGTSTGRHRR